MPINLPPGLYHPPTPEPEDDGWLSRLIGPAAGIALGGGLGFLMGGPIGAAVGAGLGGIGATEPGAAVLDTLGRPVRTLLHTGDIGQAASSIFDPSQASSVRDLRNDVGIPEFNQGEGFDAGDVIDFGIDLGTGILTDPLTYLGPGAATKVGKATMGIGRSAARMLAVEGVEGAANVARFYNEAAVKAEQQLGKALPRMALLAEGADDAMRQAHFAYARDFLENFGMGKTFRERLKLGQQTLLGYHLNPFSEGSNPLWGGNVDESVVRGVEKNFRPELLPGEQLKAAMADYLGGTNNFTYSTEQVHTPFASYTADLESSSKFADWLGEASDTIGAVARSTPLGRKLADMAVATREFLFNPVPKDALDEIQRVTGSLNAEELGRLEKKVQGFSASTADFDLETRKDITDLAQWSRPGEAGGDVAKVRADSARERLAARLNPEQMKQAHAAAETFREIEDMTFAFSQRDAKLADASRKLRDDLYADLTRQEKALAESRAAEQTLNVAKIERQTFEDAASAEIYQVNNARKVDEYQQKLAEAQPHNARNQARENFKARLRVQYPDAAEAQRVLDNTDRMAAAWAQDNARTSLNDWYMEHGALAKPDDFKYLAGMREDLGGGESLLDAFYREQKTLLEKKKSDPMVSVVNPHAVTGFMEGEVANNRLMEMAVEKGQKEGRPVFHAAGDIANLGGLNKAMGGKGGANPVMARMAHIYRDELAKLGVDMAFTHHGGDEFGISIIGGTKEEIQAALDRAEQEVQAYVATVKTKDGTPLKDIPPAKAGRTVGGTGVKFRVAEYNPKAHDGYRDAMVEAEQALEKAKGTPHVTGESAQAAGTGQVQDRGGSAGRAGATGPGAGEQAPGQHGAGRTEGKGYGEVQSAIDDLEDKYRSRGIDVDKTYDPKTTPQGLVADLKSSGYTEMPSDLAELYAKRDAIGASELKDSAEQFKKGLEFLPPEEQEIVLGKYGFSGGDTTAQALASEYVPKNAKDPKLLEEIYIGLGVKRDPAFDINDPIDEALMQDALRATNNLREKFGHPPLRSPIASKLKALSQEVLKDAEVKLTERQRASLKDIGYSDKEIDKLPVAEAKQLAEANRARSGNVSLDQLQEKGFEPSQARAPQEALDPEQLIKALKAKGIPLEELQKLTPEEIPGFLASKGIENLDEFVAKAEAGEIKAARGGAREGAGRPAKAEPTEAQRAVGEAMLRRQQEQAGGVGRILRRSLNDQDRSVIEGLYKLPGQRLGDVAAKNGGDDLTTQATAAAEAAFEKDWLAYQQGMGFQVPREARPIFQKMKRWADNVNTEEVKAKPITRNAPTPPKPTIVKPDRQGIVAPWMKTWNEYKAAVAQGSEVVKRSTSDTQGLASVQAYVDVEALRRGHLKSIKRAIANGDYVPPRVLEDYQRSPAFEQLARLNERNLVKANKQGLPITEQLYEKRQAVAAAQKAYDKAGKVGDLEYLKALRTEIEDFDAEIKNFPEHAQLYMTPEAAREVVRRKLFSTGQISNATLERKFKELGRHLTPREVNELITSDPAKAAGLIAVGGKLPEADLTMSNLLKVMSKDTATLEAIGKKVGKTAAELKAMKPEQRLTYARQAYAAIMDERPDVLLAANLESAAKTRQISDFNKQVKNLFARPIKELEMDPIEAQLIQQRRDRLYALRAAAPDPKTKDLITQLEQEVAHGHRAVEKGWVDASALGKDFEGQMLKEEVFKRALKYRGAVQDTSWMQQGFMKSFVRANQIWKGMQVGWPGSWVRDWIGNAMLRFQHDGYTAETFGQVMPLAKVLASGGDVEYLKGIRLSVGGKEIDGYTFWKDALKEGVLSHNEIQQELKATLRGRLEASTAGKVAGKLQDIQTAVPEMLRNWERLNMYHARLSKGDLPAAAAAAVDEALYNYASVSPFVDMARKTGAIPFATWMSKNIPAQLELLVTRPGQFAALLHAKQAVEAGVPGLDERGLPGYLRDKFNILLEKDADGKLWFVTTDNVVPMVDIPNLFGKSVGDYMQESLGPLPKSAIEQISNRDTFTKQDIERFDGELGIIQVPGGNDVAVPVRTKAFLKNVVGRPMSVMERSAEVLDERVDPKLNRPKGFFEQNAVVSALLGVAPRETDPTANILSDYRKWDRQADEAMRTAKRWRQKGVPTLAAAAEKRAQELRAKALGVR